jgi:ribonuclease Z
MPCNNLVEAGKDATLLIHEATMSDDQAELAAKKAHSTCGQAIDIAKQYDPVYFNFRGASIFLITDTLSRMQAQNVLLTHFSARHPKMPPGISTLENLNVGIAFDQMRLSLNQVWKLATYQDAIQESFSDMKEEEEDVVITSFDIKNKLQYSAGHNPGGI